MHDHDALCPDALRVEEDWCDLTQKCMSTLIGSKDVSTQYTSHGLPNIGATKYRYGQHAIQQGLTNTRTAKDLVNTQSNSHPHVPAAHTAAHTTMASSSVGPDPMEIHIFWG